MHVLGVPVSAELRDRWVQWLAPELQPFFVESLRPWPSSAHRPASLGPEQADTFKHWRIDRSLETLWLDEATFSGMSRRERATLLRNQVSHRRGAVPSVRRWSDVLDADTLRSQADGRRFVWWPAIVASAPHAVFSRVVTRAPEGDKTEALPSRHAEVASATWARCAAALPGAREIVGTFPESSGPNCFGTVLAAAGVTGPSTEQLLREPFQDWLDACCRPGGRDDDPGTVLVWRDRDGAPFHAAVTIGDGWALEKASTEWWTPRAIRQVRDVIRASRSPGLHLRRHHLQCINLA